MIGIENLVLPPVGILARQFLIAGNRGRLAEDRLQSMTSRE
jgi:hypothetical protein